MLHHGINQSCAHFCRRRCSICPQIDQGPEKAPRAKRTSPKLNGCGVRDEHRPGDAAAQAGAWSPTWANAAARVAPSWFLLSISHPWFSPVQPQVPALSAAWRLQPRQRTANYLPKQLRGSKVFPGPGPVALMGSHEQRCGDEGKKRALTWKRAGRASHCFWVSSGMKIHVHRVPRRTGSSVWSQTVLLVGPPPPETPVKTPRVGR